MVLSDDQIRKLEEEMREEHRRDLEALERLKRFLPGASNNHRQLSLSHEALGVENGDEEYSGSIKGKIEEVMSADPNKKWTVPKMLDHLRHLHFPLHAKKPQVSIGTAFGRLYSKEKKITLLRKGSGRIPNVYCWRVDQAENTKGRHSDGPQ